MKNATHLITASALALMLAGPALSQAALIGSEALDERIDDIQQDVAEDLEEGNPDAGPLGVPQGWRGSVALSADATSGNTDTGELSLAGRVSYGIGAWSHSAGFAAEFGEANGVRNEEKFFATYEGNRYFTENLYAFGLARYEYDGFATNENDAFLGFGPGLRIVNNADTTWRVQAGPGIRYVETAAGADDSEVGFIVASRYYHKLSQSMSLTNDTDVLGSDANTVVTNDFGINFKMTDNLSTRASYRTEYNSDPAPGLKSTDNTVGLSLVLGF